MQIRFLTTYPIENLDNGELTSIGASTRLRVIAPFRYLRKLGVDVEIISIPFNGSNNPRITVPRDSVVVVSKIMTEVGAEVVEKISRSGLRIIFDICDNHFLGATQFSHLYRRIRPWVRDYVCNTEEMGLALQREFKREGSTIFDPVELERGTAKAASPPYNMLWYGVPSGLPHLIKWLRDSSLASVDKDIGTITILTTLSAEVTKFIESRIADSLHGRLQLLPWSLQRMQCSLRSSNLVLVPMEYTPFSSTKSANRVAEAIWAGRIVISSDLPSYREFNGQGAVIAQSIGEGLDRIHSVAGQESQIIKGQDLISAKYTESVVGQHWFDLLSSI
jgi:hypothetical protein